MEVASSAPFNVEGPAAQPDAYPAGELESCCVCLDSLSASPVTILCNSVARRVCSHYVHMHCARLLRPSRCPLCRENFTHMSEPIDAGVFHDFSAYEVASSLAKAEASSASAAGASSAGAPTPATSATTQSVFELLLATLPIPERSLASNFALLGLEVGTAQMSSTDIQHLLSILGVTGDKTLPLGAVGAVGRGRQCSYSFKTRIVRRIRWALLKLTAAAGTSIYCSGCGMAVGIVIGGVVAIPRARLFELNLTNGPGIYLELVWVLFLAIYFGCKRTDLVLGGLCWGAGVGLLAGCLQGLVYVNPENHGFRSVFLNGITGRTTRSAMKCERRRRDAAPILVPVFQKEQPE
eukprot:TRINITY_DN24407_c0_g1_i1.p1 TRINITY_DN24407_c0_g1~~TRINITY_DN24407_c0_g1_i1.p1  ORF type:complete len:351 (+),score=50.45 TRINITY_DN24407_c0_g1_i1:72-1124(+)